MLNTLRIKIYAENSIERPESPRLSPVAIFASNENGRDNTRFSLDGGAFLAKGRFVLAVVRKYVTLHPEKSYEEILSVFPDTEKYK